jgi:trigger factor
MGGSRLKAEVRVLEGLRRAVDINLDAIEVREFIDGLVDAYRRRYAVPGFRPGKAPSSVILGRFQDEIERAVHQELVPRTIEQALEEHKLHPAGPGKLSRFRYNPNEPLSFCVEVEIWPEFELKPYEDLDVDRLVEEVSDPEIGQYLDWLRDRVADLQPVDRPAQSGDLVDVELESLNAEGGRTAGTEPESATIEVGAANLLPEFRAAVEGIAPAEVRDLAVAYPEDFGNEDLRGQTRRYRMTVKQIREKNLPPLDDDFARKLEGSLDLEGLRAKVRLRLESEKRLAARERLEQAIVDRLIHENPFDLPQSSVHSALDRLAQRHREDGQEVDPAELERVYRSHIERAHRRELVLVKVAEREGIEVGKDEVEAEIARMAQQEGRKVEEVRGEIADLDRFRDFMFERRVFEALARKIKVREVSVPSQGGARPAGEGAAGISGGKESADD